MEHISAGFIAEAARHCRMHSHTLAHISAASCSTYPARGYICLCSIWLEITGSPEWLNMIKRELVVPWSIAAAYFFSLKLTSINRRDIIKQHFILKVNRK
jgi:hypothetical protein